ncbi:MAG TPA: chromosome segregation protein SMC [Terrimesophilobacter sp.]|nr:chromosome segregation protein SMC [Terrimesophilobacter sp.]
MYLKSLTLKGFKSFAQPTTFAFEPGVTCVVGPNGSGKSNVVDALAWVMGEQGAKTLRGGKMEDVIFAGTATKGPLGRAEVLLTIDNSDGALPIEYTEVTISRTLFRNGGSEYAINGEACRLLDVQELLSDSGLGREMHVIVGQGQLDQVLHASPEDRRGFIEEAAGILKHRRRKEKTLRKLEAMQANLTRLSDLAGEIRRQLKPLGQQAEIAREAQSIAAIVRDARARLLADELVTLRTAIADFAKSESERKTERLVLQEQLDQNKLREQRIEQEQQSDAVDQARRTAFGLEQVHERLRALYTLANQRIALLGDQAESTEFVVGVSEQQVAEARAEAVRLESTVVEAEATWQDRQSDTERARANLAALDEELALQASLVSQHELDLSRLAGAVESAASTLAAVRGEVLRQQNALDAAKQRHADATQQLAEVEAEVGSVETDTELDDAYEAAGAEVTAVEAAIETLRERLHGLERERDALAARSGALSRALEVKDGATQLAAANVAGVRGIVADHVTVSAGFEAAITAVLGSLAEGVLADDADSAVRALEHARSKDFGRVEVVIASSSADAPMWPTLAGVVPASSVVKAPEGVLGILSHVAVADDLAAARAAREPIAKAGLRHVTLVTKAGEVLTEHVLRGGSGGKQGRIELIAERDAAAQRLREVEALSVSARDDLTAKRTVLDESRRAAALALSALRDFDAQLASKTEKLNRARVGVEAALAEAERLERGLALATTAVDEATIAHTHAVAAHDNAEAAPKPILDVTERDALATEVDSQRELELEARLALETARERVRSEQERADALARTLENERAAAQEAARRSVIRRHRLERAERVVTALPAVLDAVDRSVAQARVQLASREAERSEQNEQLAALRKDEAELRMRLTTVSESVQGLEMQIYEKKLHANALVDRALEELGLVEDVLVAEYGPEVPVPAEDPDAEDPDADTSTPFVRAEQEARLATFERKLAQLGRVNPLALEEFAALEQRHKFLTDQLADLTNTRKDLLTIIDELDDRMKDIFKSAFDDTKAAFNEVFPVLFPGGTGSIRLTDPDELLTTGIEVNVKPAGKKIERLSLLSGGERSLAAIALLVAIFKARPSPFYILDEVEAALDDANLGRLLSIFEELRSNSQLIIITHQKRTMEIADALYGVSMRQDGVSAVVGQRVAHD